MRGRIAEKKTEIDSLLTIRKTCEIKKFDAAFKKMQYSKFLKEAEDVLDSFISLKLISRVRKGFVFICFKSEDRFTATINKLMERKIIEGGYLQRSYVFGGTKSEEMGTPIRSFRDIKKEDLKRGIVFPGLHKKALAVSEAEPNLFNLGIDLFDSSVRLLEEIFKIHKNIYTNGVLLNNMIEAIENCDEETNTRRLEVRKLKAALDMNSRISSLVFL